MVGGFTPFREDDSMSLLDKMRQGDMELPKNMDGVTRDLVKQCLVYDQEQRIQIEGIKSHKMMRKIDWKRVAKKQGDSKLNEIKCE